MHTHNCGCGSARLAVCLFAWLLQQHLTSALRRCLRATWWMTALSGIHGTFGVFRYLLHTLRSSAACHILLLLCACLPVVGFIYVARLTVRVYVPFGSVVYATIWLTVDCRQNVYGALKWQQQQIVGMFMQNTSITVQSLEHGCHRTSVFGEWDQRFKWHKCAELYMYLYIYCIYVCECFAEIS